ncbi:MAG: hypothetical protein OEX22_08500 [Cyclobacteriaceae bacterium]|nr:hypothetical protein [Cyclobacteriaceae bacterium]
MHNILHIRTSMYLIIVLSFLSCEKKVLEIDIVESVCKDFSISHPQYTVLENIGCDTIPEVNAFLIDFEFLGEEDCLDYLEISEIHFFNSTDVELTNISLVNEGLIPVEDPSIVKSGINLSYQLCYQFSNLADTSLFNHLVIQFHTENEVENESNTLSMRLNKPGAIPPTASSIVNTFYVESQYITLSLWDDAAEDGDILSIAVNNEWQEENFEIFKNPRDISLNLIPGENNIVFYAVNEGSSPPNTGKMSIDDGFSVHTFDISMSIFETRGVTVFVQ